MVAGQSMGLIGPGCTHPLQQYSCSHYVERQLASKNKSNEYRAVVEVNEDEAVRPSVSLSRLLLVVNLPAAALSDARFSQNFLAHFRHNQPKVSRYPGQAIKAPSESFPPASG